MPTRRGVGMLGAGAALVVLGRVASSGELAGVGLAAIVLTLAAAVFVRLGRHRVSATRAVASTRVFSGGTLRLTLSARNDARATSPPVILEDSMPPELGGPARVALPPLRRRGDIATTIERPALARGRYRVGPLSARLPDPFGLAVSTRVCAPATTVVVYPRVEVLGEQGPPEPRRAGGHSPVYRLSPAGDELYAVRAWQDGDDLRKIHWRSTARTSKLMIRQDETRPVPRASILFDTRASVHGGRGEDSSFEWGVSAAASIALELSRDGFAMRLVTADPQTNGVARTGREASDALLCALAVVRPSSEATLAIASRAIASGARGGGALFALLAPPARDEIVALARASSGYEWRGAVLLDVASFSGVPPRQRASFDQRLADADRLLSRAGWRVAVAGASEQFKPVWQRLLDSGAHRPSLRSRLS